MPLNWGIEARKWQLALRPVGGISFIDAFRAIFTGATMASFTPNRMGEYLGRILYVKEGRRKAAISLTIACSIAQLLVTLAIVAAGGYAALDILASVKIIKPDLQAKIRPFGTIIGLACVALVVVGLFW